MSFQNEKIGMMDEGYFVSRGDILKWVNDLLQLNLTKIQQLGSAAVYCQVIDVIHPNSVAINKVNWKAKNDYEFVQNYRILQDSFKKNNIKRYIEVQKLAKAKYQDNLQFAQWLKRYYDLNCGDRGNNYLAEQKRGGIIPDFGFAEKNVVPKTYNSTGQIIPTKKQSPPKKTQVIVPTKKAPEVALKKVTQQISTIPKSQAGERHKKATQKGKQQSPKNKQQTNENQQYLQNCLRHIEQKLQMVTEIVKSKELSDLKIQMIAQILQINLDVEQKKQETYKTHQEEQGQTLDHNEQAL